MLVNVSTHGSGTSVRPGTPDRRTHDDAPDTATAFARLAAMEEGPERDVVRDELVRAWLPMAHRIAGRFRNRGESLEDLRQVAAMGLVKAVDRYEPERGRSRATPCPPSPERSSGTFATGCGRSASPGVSRTSATRCAWHGVS